MVVANPSEASALQHYTLKEEEETSLQRFLRQSKDCFLSCFSCVKCCACCFCELNEVVHEVTFPAPKRGLNVYEIDLLPKEDLVWLNINPSGKGEVRPIDCIPALFIKADENKKSEYTVIYSHGNAEDIGEEQHFVRDFARRINCDILLYEYPGYSLSKFTADNEKDMEKLRPSEKKLFLAVEAAYRYLVNDLEINPKKIILYGRSIGSGPSLHLASRSRIPGVRSKNSPQNLGGVFLVAPFLSTIRAVLGHKTATLCFCYDMFPNHRNVKSVASHIAIMHARDDDIVSFDNGEELYKNFPKKEFEPQWLNEGQHNYISTRAIIEYFNKFKEFLALEQEAIQAEMESKIIAESQAAMSIFELLQAQAPTPNLKDFFPSPESMTQSEFDESPMGRQERRMMRLHALRDRLAF